MKKHYKLLLVLVCTLSAFTAQAVNRTWVGPNNGSFNTAGNWSPSGVPSASDNITIDPSGNMRVRLNGNITINNLILDMDAGGSRVLDLEANGYILTINGTTTTSAGASDEVYLDATDAPGGFVFNGDVSLSETGSGLTWITADDLSQGSMWFNANLTTGNNAYTTPGDEPKWFFDKVGTQSWTFNSTSWYIVPHSITVGVSNTPTLNIVGTGNDYRVDIYDGILTVSAGATLDIGKFYMDKFVAGGAHTLEAGATMRTGETNTLSTGYSAYNFDETSTVEYYGASQSVRSRTYGNLELSGTGTKTSASNFTINGDFVTNCAWNDGNDTHTFSGSTTQDIGGTVAPTMYNMILNNAASPAMNMVSNITFDRVLTLTNGMVSTNANTLISTYTNTGSITSHGVTDFVNTGASGTLRRYVAATGSYDFPVGNSNSYQLLNLNITGGNTASYFDCNFANTAVSYTSFVETSYNYAGVVLNNGGTGTGVGNADPGVWTLDANAGTANYSLTLNGRNTDNPGSRHTILKSSQTPGSSTTEVDENFDACSGSAPSGWSTSITSGVADWDFDQSSCVGFSIDGTCMASFDDDAQPSSGDNTVVLYSPVVDMSGYASGTLNYDWQLRVSGGLDNLTTEVYDGSSWVQVFYVNSTSSGSESTDLTPYLNNNFQVRYTYDDSDGWGWGGAIDNVEIIGTSAPSGYGAYALDGTYSSCSTSEPIQAVRTGMSGFSKFTLAVANSMLPVELLDFATECKKNEVTVSWSTASEENNDYYTVMVSADGMRFVPIGTVSGAGTSNSENYYEFIDKDPYHSTAYYKLRQTDYNGEFEEFNPVSQPLCAAADGEINVFPNPADQSFNIDLGPDADGDFEVVLIDVAGKIVMIKDIEIRNGFPSSDINIARLAVGVYTIKLSGEGQILTSKLYKK